MSKKLSKIELLIVDYYLGGGGFPKLIPSINIALKCPSIFKFLDPKNKLTLSG